MPNEISVSSDSGRALGFELDVELLRTLPTVECFGRIRKGPRRFEPQMFRRMGTLPLYISFHSQVLPPTGNPLDQCTCRARGFYWSDDID